MIEIITIPVGQLEANCYIVIDESSRTAAVIDPGDDAEIINQVIQKANVEVEHILLTHGHPDHSYAASRLQEFHPVKVRLHENDVYQLQGEPDIIALYFDGEDYGIPVLGEPLQDGEVLKLGNTDIKTLWTPGHSPGSVCFVVDKTVFTGDTLFAGSVGRTDFVGGSSEDLMSSLTNKLMALPDETVAYPGHGPKSTIGHERRMNPFLA